jgi:hypothetical protein
MQREIPFHRVVKELESGCMSGYLLTRDQRDRVVVMPSGGPNIQHATSIRPNENCCGMDVAKSQTADTATPSNR